MVSTVRLGSRRRVHQHRRWRVPSTDTRSHGSQRYGGRRSLKGWHLHAHLSYEVANAGFPRQSSNWHRYAVDANGTLRMVRERYCRQRNAAQEENYRARKRSRRRNGSRRN